MWHHSLQNVTELWRLFGIWKINLMVPGFCLVHWFEKIEEESKKEWPMFWNFPPHKQMMTILPFNNYPGLSREFFFFFWNRTKGQQETGQKDHQINKDQSKLKIKSITFKNKRCGKTFLFFYPSHIHWQKHIRVEFIMQQRKKGGKAIISWSAWSNQPFLLFLFELARTMTNVAQQESQWHEEHSPFSFVDSFFNLSTVQTRKCKNATGQLELYLSHPVSKKKKKKRSKVKWLAMQFIGNLKSGRSWIRTNLQNSIKTLFTVFGTHWCARVIVNSLSFVNRADNNNKKTTSRFKWQPLITSFLYAQSNRPWP